jgi:hypothetical protein
VFHTLTLVLWSSFVHVTTVPALVALQQKTVPNATLSNPFAEENITPRSDAPKSVAESGNPFDVSTPKVLPDSSGAASSWWG